MSLRPMHKHCTHCHRTYTYNPSVSDLGLTCKHCHAIQLPVYVPLPKPLPPENPFGNRRRSKPWL